MPRRQTVHKPPGAYLSFEPGQKRIVYHEFSMRWPHTITEGYELRRVEGFAEWCRDQGIDLGKVFVGSFGRSWVPDLRDNADFMVKMRWY